MQLIDVDDHDDDDGDCDRLGIRWKKTKTQAATEHDEFIDTRTVIEGEITVCVCVFVRVHTNQYTNTQTHTHNGFRSRCNGEKRPDLYQQTIE